jgi:hypothetical protein
MGADVARANPADAGKILADELVNLSRLRRGLVRVHAVR